MSFSYGLNPLVVFITKMIRWNHCDNKNRVILQICKQTKQNRCNKDKIKPDMEVRKPKKDKDERERLCVALISI